MQIQIEELERLKDEVIGEVFRLQVKEAHPSEETMQAVLELKSRITEIQNQIDSLKKI